MEIRKIWTSEALNDYLDFPYVGQVFCLKRYTEHLSTGKVTTEISYGVTSLSSEKADPSQLMQLVRGHWRIENSLHWVRDVTFDEDRCRIRKGNGPRNMASLRNLAISLLRLAGADYIAKAGRYCARIGDKVLRLIGIDI